MTRFRSSAVAGYPFPSGISIVWAISHTEQLQESELIIQTLVISRLTPPLVRSAIAERRHLLPSTSFKDSLLQSPESLAFGHPNHLLAFRRQLPIGVSALRTLVASLSV